MLATQRLTDLSITESVPSAELETSMRAVDWLTAIALSVVASTAQEALTRMADVGTIVVKCWAGRILVGVGLWLIVLALGANIFARFSGQSARSGSTDDEGKCGQSDASS